MFISPDLPQAMAFFYKTENNMVPQKNRQVFLRLTTAKRIRPKCERNPANSQNGFKKGEGNEPF
jgi:hypothetical protein